MSDVPAVLFADDVLLSAKSPEGLQILMDISTIWAKESGMTWNTRRGKSEILESAETRGYAFKLALRELNQVKEVTYLGVSVSEEGVTDSKMLERIHNARIAIYQLRALGVFSHGLSLLKAFACIRRLSRKGGSTQCTSPHGLTG